MTPRSCGRRVASRHCLDRKEERRAITALALAAVVGIGSGALLSGSEPLAAPGGCKKGQCRKDYDECTRTCGVKIDCLISCETRLEICLSNCPN